MIRRFSCCGLAVALGFVVSCQIGDPSEVSVDQAGIGTDDPQQTGDSRGEVAQGGDDAGASINGGGDDPQSGGASATSSGGGSASNGDSASAGQSATSGSTAGSSSATGGDDSSTATGGNGATTSGGDSGTTSSTGDSGQSGTGASGASSGTSGDCWAEARAYFGANVAAKLDLCRICHVSGAAADVPDGDALQLGDDADAERDFVSLWQAWKALGGNNPTSRILLMASDTEEHTGGKLWPVTGTAYKSAAHLFELFGAADCEAP